MLSAGSLACGRHNERLPDYTGHWPLEACDGVQGAQEEDHPVLCAKVRGQVAEAEDHARSALPASPADKAPLPDS